MAFKKRKRIPWGWVSLAVAAVAGGGSYYWQSRVAAANATKLPQGVQVGRAERGVLAQKISASGDVVAETGAKVNIGSQISGVIRSLPADVGTHVKAGQVVAVLDAPDLQAQVEQQRQNVRVSQANLDQAESRLSQAVLNASMTTAQTDAQVNQARASLRGAGARLKTSEATARYQPLQTTSDIAKAQAALNTAKSQEQQVQATVRSQILQAQTNLDDARATLANMSSLRRRQEALLIQGYISPQDVDDTRARHLSAVAKARSAQANLQIIEEKTTIDLQTAHDQVAQAQAALAAAQSEKLEDAAREADRESAQEAVGEARSTLALQQANRTQDVIRQRAVQEARGAVRQAAASLHQTQAALKYQEALMDKAIIRSPIDGTVLTINTQQGETVAAGFQVQTLITVADLNRLVVRAYVDETDIGRTRLGLPAEVRVQSFPDTIFHGRVTKIASASTIKDNVVTYETTVTIQDHRNLLRPDMTADVTLILGSRPNVLLVPSEAVHREIGRSTVYVLHRDRKGKDRVEPRVVKTGMDDGSHTEIRGNLREGEEVILAGLPRLGVEAPDSQAAGKSGRKR